MGTSIKIKKWHTAGELQNHLKTIVDEKQKLRVRAIISLLNGVTIFLLLLPTGRV